MMIREYAILEYYKVIGMLAERAVSALAKDICLTLTPRVDKSEIKYMRAETDDAVSVCLRKGTPPFSDIPDLNEPLFYAEKGGSLSLRQLLLVCEALGAAKRVRAFLTSDMPEAPSVRELAGALVPLPDLEKRIKDAVLSDTEIADGASAELRRIRRAMERQNEKIRASLAHYITGKGYEDILMDKVVTMRNGRFVLPVKQEQAGRFPGIIHDRSKGGATVFVEPQSVVVMNNGLRELELEERTEIDRILAEFSAEVGASSLLIRENQELLVRLDFFFAKANLSLDMRANPAEQSEEGYIEIEGGRNPLIDKEKVVPVSVHFGGYERILIITGPNTGGKTVTLKTTGLFILMAQAGLHVPASRAVLPVCPRVFADIGDEQSIEQSLSTFSSHMKNIVEIVSGAAPDSVVLLDELGAGTDPTEGAALAIAILETLRARGCLVMATTHYTELKKYAIQADDVANASMEFDLVTLSPTYRLNMGNPGRSNAFEIASKLGLRTEIVARARGLLDAETVYFDDVMEQIERDRKDAAAHLAETKRAEAEAMETLAAAEAQLRKNEEKREAILEKAHKDAEEILEEAIADAEETREELKELIREARVKGVADGTARRLADAFGISGGMATNEAPADAGDLLRRADESRKKLKKRSKKTKGSGSSFLRETEKSVSPVNAPLARGDFVTLPGTDTAGEILTDPDDRGRVIVRAGAVRLTLAASELERRAKPVKNPGQGKGRYAKIVLSKMDQIGPSIDLHGKNLDEAEMMVEKYLDNAVLARMHEVVINHGRGSGILRDGIRRMLKGHKHVAKYRNGDFDEGGDGVTIVTLSNR